MMSDRQADRTSQQGDGQDDASATPEPTSAGGGGEVGGEVADRENARPARDARGSVEASGTSGVDRGAGVERLGDEEAGDGMGS
jgi:hypothetical protein